MNVVASGFFTQHTVTALSAFWLFKTDKAPNEQAIAVSDVVGWLTLLAAIALIVILILHREAWRKWWLTAEDPRTLGLYRIVFSFTVMANMTDFSPYWRMLFTDEGIFTADVARHVHARHQFAGFGDGFTSDSPAGFFDIWGVLRFLEGPKYSLLYFWDSPTFFTWYMVAFYACATLLMVGFRTRLMGVLTWFLMNGVFFRNHLFWEGTEVLYRVFLVYLICSRSGYAYSIDNWLRCRQLRRQHRLSERTDPECGSGAAPSGEHPYGKAAIYRLIPSWPRKLAMMQLATIYTTTGILKNGAVWGRGDSIYYAWNMDHFYRWEPQRLTALFGTNLLKLASWVTHWGEILFGLIFVGMIVRFAIDAKLPGLSGAKATIAKVAWLIIILVSSALIWVTWEVHFTPTLSGDGLLFVLALVGVGFLATIAWVALRRIAPHAFDATRGGAVFLAVALAITITFFILTRGRYSPLLRAHTVTFSKIIFVIGWTAGWLTMMSVWHRIAHTPLLVQGRTGLWLLGGLAIAIVDACILGLSQPYYRTSLALILVSAAAFTIATVITLWLVLRKLEASPDSRWRTFLVTRHPIDREWVAKWLLGRRIWLTFHVGLMGGIFVLMNIGWFQPGMLTQTLAFLTGAEVAWGLQKIGFRLRLTPHPTPVRAEHPSLPHLHRDTYQVPQNAMFVTLSLVVLGVLVRATVWEKTWPWYADWRWIWVLAVAFIAGVAWREYKTTEPKPLSTIDPFTGSLRVPWAYGFVGRFVASSLLIWHLTAVATWLSPAKDSLSTWRPEARDVFETWLRVTTTDQGWGMFAPNPPRSNVFLRVLVTTDDGEVHDLNTDVYASERRPLPFIINDRMRKMNRRIIGGESGNSEWYRKWYARFICREWGIHHDGIEPMKVELVKYWYAIPSPTETARKGPYKPMELLASKGRTKVESTEHCRTAVMGQIPNVVRKRYGLPPLRKGWKERPWLKHKKRSWDRLMTKWRGEQPATPSSQRTSAVRKP